MSDAQALMARMHPVSIDAIETELDNQWRNANANAAASGGYVGARNSVLTLVISTAGTQQAARVFDTVQMLTSVHPSRAVVLTSNERAADGPIAAYVCTQSATTAGTPAYGEEILIDARGDAAKHLPGVVLPLIVGGLPSYLWWTDEPPWRTEQLNAMVDGCDRLMVDTSEMAHPERGLSELDDLMYRKRSSCAVSDFNWTRQAPWRELVAQFFDSPSMLPYLYGLTRVSVEYAAGVESEPVNSAAAYLFAGWLASRLGWKIQGGQRVHGSDDTRTHTLTDQGGRAIALELNARFGAAVRSWHEIVPEQLEASQSGQHQVPAASPCVGPGALMTVHLHAAVGGQNGSFAVARERDMQHASTLCQVPGSAVPSQTVHLPSIGEASLLTEQLELQGHDQVYEEALSLASHLLGPAARRMP